MQLHIVKLGIGGLFLLGIACLVQAFVGFSTLEHLAGTVGESTEKSGLHSEARLDQNQAQHHIGNFQRVDERLDLVSRAAAIAHPAISPPRSYNIPTPAVPNSRIRMASTDGIPKRRAANHLSPNRIRWANSDVHYPPAPHNGYPSNLGLTPNGMVPRSLRGAYFSPMNPRKPTGRMCFFRF